MEKTEWKKLIHPYSSETDNALQQQYLAAQFIALAGRYLIPKKQDGSNINMQFIPEKEMLLGNSFPDGWAVGVLLKNLTVQILNENGDAKTEISLAGQTFQEAFQEFKTALQS